MRVALVPSGFIVSIPANSLFMTIRAPSGDHAAEKPQHRTKWALVPSLFMIEIPGSPPESGVTLEKTILVPSGDHFGAESNIVSSLLRLVRPEPSGWIV